MFVLLNFIFRDLHVIVKAEFLADAVNGIYNGREVTDAMFVLGGVLRASDGQLVVVVVSSWSEAMRASTRVRTSSRISRTISRC